MSRTAAHLRQSQQGMSMLEVLISLVILGVGILGMMALQASSMRSNQSAFYRTQASFYGAEIAEKMRSNRLAFTAGDYNVTNSKKASWTTDCTTNTCSAGDVAEFDLVEWNLALGARMPSGRGIVCPDVTPRDGTFAAPACDNTTNPFNTYAVKIFWDDDGDGTEELNYVLAVRL